jgi:hypothetical protein
VSPAAPIPFELLQQDGQRIATNGFTTVVLRAPAEQGRMFRRRGLRGVALAAPGQAVLPELNRLAGDLLQQLDMPAAQLAERLAAIAALAAPVEPEPVEWAVAELDGVRVYVDGSSVIVTREDLNP